MKKITFISLLLVGIVSVKGQNSCADAQIVQAGIHTIEIIDGEGVFPHCFTDNDDVAVAMEWFSYTPNNTTTVSVRTGIPENDAIYVDSRLHLYTGACNALTCLDSNDDVNGSLTSEIIFEAIAGQEYFIAFDDHWQNAGYQFIIEEEYLSGNLDTILFAETSISLVGDYDICIVDMNGDFLDDIVSVSSTNIQIQYQESSGVFTPVDYTIPATTFLPGWSLAAADYDGNGYTDLAYGDGNGVTLMTANDSGTMYTEHSFTEYVFSQRTNFSDINNDGHLDLFVCHDVGPNIYFLNDGSNTLQYNQGGLGDYPEGGDYGSIWVDYDNDRDVDLFIAKCGGNDGKSTDQMLTNNSDGTYTENASAIGLADPMQTWSSTWGDFNNDGWMDVFVSSSASISAHKLMQNNGNGTFTEIEMSEEEKDAPIGHECVSYDFNNDGYLDIAVNGDIFIGNGDFTFTVSEEELPYENGAFGDLNNDGWMDMYVNDVIYYNQTDNGNNWVKINLVGLQSNRNGIGARIEISTNQGTQIREVRSGEGYKYMNTLTSHFGLGTEDTIDAIIIYWPSGQVDTYTNVSSNQSYVYEEGGSLSVADYELSDAVIYPNPVEEVLRVNTTADLSVRNATIFSLEGKKIFSSAFNGNQLNVSFLPSGVYVLRMEHNGKVHSEQIIKK